MGLTYEPPWGFSLFFTRSNDPVKPVLQTQEHYPMPKVAPIDQRKADHIKINLEQDVRSALTSGLEKYHFVHEALPELDLNRIDTSLSLFVKKLNSPILISSMTGCTSGS